ncbi:MAG: hypothetical protein QF632_01910 [Candidatus Woesearchaeota archaeon]|jgi:hypothetical protein|nr:hypothetical protein [Candidatus Woesearchaeota archaeon]MDP7323496.1 hypothetical protein [Candidatus Woesearchaeota archaeon]
MGIITKSMKYALIVGSAFYMGYGCGIKSPKRPIEPLSKRTSYLDYTVREIIDIGKNKMKQSIEDSLMDEVINHGNE